MEDTQSNPDSGEDRSQKTAESLRALRQQADQTLNDHRERVGEIETRLNSQLELIAQELARERLAEEQTLANSAEQAATLEQLRQTLAEKEVEVVDVLEQLAAQSIEFEKQIAERDEELEQLLELNDEEGHEGESLQQELAEARQALEALQSQECAECARSQAELTELGERLSQLDEQFQNLQAAHEAQRAELEQSHQATEAAQQQSEQATACLAEAEQRLEELVKLEQTDEQLEQTRRKFELALADVHKLKRENAELREELVSRPEASDQESPELVSLRSERDALAERVADLENAPAAETDADSQQEVADLQRRFELAVDDVRQLKQENAELRQQLEASPAAATAIKSNDEPQDWEAQKARLMATLDAEDQGTIDESRRQERTTIEGTISITDRVVAEKDALLAKREAEIADLRAQLEERPEGQNTEELREQIAAEILADDEAVQAEVERMRHQQELLDSKLREAELEMSIQRATLAREEAALEEKLALLPTLETVDDDVDGELAAEKPRRRWLSALGIKDEEES